MSPPTSDRSSTTRTLFRPFTKARSKKGTSATAGAGTTTGPVQTSPSKSASGPTPVGATEAGTPASPRDLLTERRLAMHKKGNGSIELERFSTPISRAAERKMSPATSTAIFSNPIPHNLVKHDAMPHSPSANVSLADSSITTDIVFVPSVASTQEASESTIGTTAHSTFAATRPAGEANAMYEPRSLRELKRDLRSTHPPALQRALQQITLDCWDDPNARSLIARVGGILSICHILEDFAGCSDVLVAACQALSKLALDADNELAVAEIGGLDILWNVATGSTDSKVSEAAWEALQNCTCQIGDWDTDMQMWVQVLQDESTNPATTAHACAAAANLCVSSTKRSHAFGQSGGIVAMAQALERHWNDEEARADISQSLARLCECLSPP